MVLLKGLNFDYSGQVTSELDSDLGNGSTSIRFKNIAGFSANDYILLNPRNETAEIVQISAGTGQSFTITATTFKHTPGEKIYRIPYNKMKFYKSSTADGAYSFLSGSETGMLYEDSYTRYNYGSGTSSDYYKRTFYNSTTLLESDITLSNYWQTSDEELYITPQELRTLMSFGENDLPNPNDMREQIKLAMRKISLDVTSSNPDVLFIATFLLSKAYVLKSLAARSLSKGYVTINVEGRSVMKAYQELVLESENTIQEYMDFISNQTRSEVTSTKYFENIVDASTVQDIKDRLTGSNNAVDYQSRFTFGYRSRRSI